MIKILIRLCFLLSLALVSVAVTAQDNAKIYDLKKGQIFDVLLRTNNTGATQEKKDKFNREVIPIALEQGYQLMPSGLYFEPVAIQGNYSPDHMILGGWESLKARENAMRVLVAELPYFHQIRRELWTTLFSTYFEIEEDISFSIREDKFYVVTAYHHKSERQFGEFKKEWARNIDESKGRIILELENGESPFIGHLYEPHRFIITEWTNRESFEIFLTKNKQMDHSSIKYVNQFALQPKF